MEKLKEAIKYIKEWEDELPPVITKTLFDLASQVVAMEGKMVEKKIRTYISRGGVTLKKASDISLAKADSFNEARNLCTLAFVGMLGEKKGYCSIVKNYKELKKATEIDRARVDGRNAYRAEILKKIKGE